RLLDARALAALRALGKPVVWTLHDEWAYTGGCHYAAGCGRWRDGCRDCPQLANDPHGLVELRFAQKASACADGAMTVVAPSRWLAANARESSVFRGSRVEVVPYGVDLTAFSPERRAAGRRRLGASQDDFVLLFSAEAAFERRKGFAELAAALATLRARADELGVAAACLKLAVLGHGYGVALPEDAVPLGHVSSREELAEIAAASDLYVMPSLEDNLPNGVLEALASGTPCVGFDIGGVPDMLADAPGCALAPAGDSVALAARIASAARGGIPSAALRCSIRAFAETRYAPARQAEAYLAIYRSLVSGKVRAA
ncbi:MAG: glycosyltransferase, partial [Phycisphaerales bacterium]